MRKYTCVLPHLCGDLQVGEITVIEPLTEEEAEELEIPYREIEEVTTWTHCDSIEVYEPYRNQGYGTEALELLGDIYGRYTITPDNPDAARLYDRLGTEDLSWEGAYYTDQGYGVYEI